MSSTSFLLSCHVQYGTAITQSFPFEISEQVPGACLFNDSSNRFHNSLYRGLGSFSLSCLSALTEKDSRIMSRHLWASSTTIAPRLIGLLDPVTPKTDLPLNSLLQFVIRMAAELRNAGGGFPPPGRSPPGAAGNWTVLNPNVLASSTVWLTK